MIQLHKDLCNSLIWAESSELDVISSVDVQIHDVIAQADSMKWELDLKSLWLTKARWTMMVRQYLDPELLEEWLGKCSGIIGTKGRGIAVMRTKIVKPRGGATSGATNKETRRWGSCMIALSYKALPRPTITLYSRTSYLGYIGALDMTVAWMCGKYLAKELGISAEDISFVWVNSAIQWHNFKSLAYLLHHETNEEEFRRILINDGHDLSVEEKRAIIRHPALKLSRKWLRGVVLADRESRHYGEVNYGTFLRVIKRFHTEVYGEDYADGFEGWAYHRKGPQAGEKRAFIKKFKKLPSVTIDKLDFSGIGMPMSRSYGEPFVESDEDELVGGCEIDSCCCND